MQYSSNKATITGNSILLFSGGMDSVMFNTILKPDLLLYIPTGSKYEEVESKKIQHLIDRGFIDENKLVKLPNILDLSTFERADAIVPNRNIYLITLASMYAETIWLGSVQGDRSTDKDEKFYEHMEGLLNHVNQAQHWTEGRTFHISSPLKELTKTELLQLFLDKGGDINAILESYSCYSGEDLPCGVCKPCFRKWVALENVVSGFSATDYFTNAPWNAEWLPEALPFIKKGEHRGKEDFYVISALKKKTFKI